MIRRPPRSTLDRSSAASDVYKRQVLHWLPIPQRIVYRLSALVWRCLLGSAPAYLQELCRSTLDVQGRRALRSSTHGELLVPRARTALRQHRAFSVADLMVWNGLPLTLRLSPRVHLDELSYSLKTIFLCCGWGGG